LIQGEERTGKEVIAKKIHELLIAANAPLVSDQLRRDSRKRCCSANFRHERCFHRRGEHRKRPVELADGGTPFPSMKSAKWLVKRKRSCCCGFLQEGEIHRVPKAPIRASNVRIISATNKELETQVKNNKFREDLYYRVNTVTMRICCVKRPEDACRNSIEKFLRLGTHGLAKSIRPKARWTLLRSVTLWLRQRANLQNTVERFKIPRRILEVIGENDNLFNVKKKNPGSPEADYFDGSGQLLAQQVEKRHILRVLVYFSGNKTKAANAG
jgi:transcriptional regulator with PAS, ATPase and Fis domain